MTTLAEELTTDPLGRGYAALWPNNLGAILDLLNQKDRTVVRSRMTSARGIAEKYPGGPLAAEEVLQKLEAFSVSTNPAYGIVPAAVKRQLGFLAGEGLDFGSAALRSMLDQFVTLGVITSTEATNLKSIAEFTGSRIEELGLGVVTASDVVAIMGA